MPTQPFITVEGFDDLRENLRKIDDKLGKEMGKANKEIGTKIVEWTEPRRGSMAARFGSYRSKLVKIKPSANQRRVLVNVRPAAAETGIRRHPVFGTWRDQRSFKRRVWPEPDPTGYLVRPTVSDRAPQIAGIYLDALTKLAREAIGE